MLSFGTVASDHRSDGGSLGISNQLPLSLGGVIASLKLSLDPNKAKRGVKTTATVSLDAYDASGAEIVGPSDYTKPIELTIEGDTKHTFALHLRSLVPASRW